MNDGATFQLGRSMRTVPHSLDEYAAHLARRLGFAGGLALAAIFVFIFATFSFAYYRLLIEKAFATQVESFSFWLQINDRYQIQRALAGLAESQNLGGALVLDNGANIIAQKGDLGVINHLSEGSFIGTIKSGFLLHYEFELLESGALPVSIGKIVIGQVIPYSYIIVCILGFALLVTLAMQFTKRSFGNIAKEMTRPVRDLAATVSRAKSLDDLRSIDPMSAEYSELQLLIDKISEMSERLVCAEKFNEKFNLGRQVAHDIRSPLSALRMAVGSAKNLDVERRDLIMTVAERIDRIAEDLLESSRVNPGIVEFDLLPACQEIVTEKEANIDRNRLEIKLEVQNAANSLKLKGDRKEFQRLLSNLINNAIESITSFGRIRVAIYSASPFTKIEIIDNGMGIPENVLEHLHKGSAFTTKQSGSGLGLLHARRTIESWNGHLSIRSELGSGTKITLSLPQT